ncbi:hypothetical protein [Dehalobacter sp. TeCB1]|uniref:hypothetical protein n=1 Tax=Dehalobacter sp. TeCB1 TaxID=1843715 RepID=UPI00083B900C|nr:hypothetical protein [Dehalobacter sp. TeCB1]OCZ53791.1 hypothetical protein A7D23_07465 [Dehalobacter sp. TeCB1]
MARRMEGVISIRDNASSVLDRMRQRQRQFRQDVQRTGSVLQSVFGENIQSRPVLRALDTVERSVRRVGSAARSVGRIVARPVITVRDQATSGIKKIAGSLNSLKGLAVAVGIGAAITGALSSGAMLEQQQVSMQHFIGVNNAGMSQSAVKQTSDQYLKDLRQNANVTPFGTSEVVSAGTRAINVAGGDTKNAMEMVKLAEDMAALNPEKTLSDAMEALADLKVGETERMKEFGFKISQDDIKNAGGIDSVIQKQLQPFFKGGAEKLSTTGAGLFSNITGQAGSLVQDMGLSALEALKPVMQSIISVMDQYGPAMSNMATSVGTGITTVIQAVGRLKDWISEKFGFILNDTSALKEVGGSAISGFKQVFSTAMSVLGPVANYAINMVRLLYEVFMWAFPGIKAVVSTVWDIVGPILSALGSGIGFVAEKVGSLADWVASKRSGGKAPAKNALGTSYFSGGATWVAEHGPELISLPSGSKISTAQQTKAMAGGKNPTVIVNINGSNLTPEQVIGVLVPQLKIALANM